MPRIFFLAVLAIALVLATATTFAQNRTFEAEANVEVTVWQRVSDGSLYLSTRPEGGRWTTHSEALDMSNLSRSGRFRQGSAISVAVPVTVDVQEPTPLPATCGDMEGASRSVLASTVKVQTNEGSGTAFYVGNNEFITAAHVVDGATEVQLLSNRLPAVDAEVVGYLTGPDLAVLQARAALPPLRWRVADPNAGMNMGVAGYPGGLGSEASVTRGIVSRVFTEGSVSLVQTDAAASPGNSGGPLFDDCGRVFGVVVSKVAALGYEGLIFGVVDPSLGTGLATIRRGQGQKPAESSSATSATLWVHLTSAIDYADRWRISGYVIANFEVARLDLEVYISADGGRTEANNYPDRKVYPDEIVTLGTFSRLEITGQHTDVNFVRAVIDQPYPTDDLDLRCTKHATSTATESVWACNIR